MTTQTPDTLTPDERAARLREVQAELDQLYAERDGRAAPAGQAPAAPTTDADVSADETVAELEARIADGDETVTADQLTDARTAAAGRVRFGKLREIAADRKARKNADQAERERVERARQAARDALNGDISVEIATAYDDAIDAISRLVRVSGKRYRDVIAFAQGQGDHVLPAHEREPNPWPSANAVIVDGKRIAAEGTSPSMLVKSAIGVAGVGVAPGRKSGSPTLAVGRPAADPSERPAPAIVVRGRAARAAGSTPDDAA